MLDTPVGQLIVASCVVDDVLALILLSMFKVLVKDSPPIYEYFIPIISSVGFLIVLGGSAVTWMPRMIEDKILNKCSESYRELVMFSIMVVMLLAYLPLLNYTQASYLTGAFLAGVTFSQINHAHHAFMEKTHQLMTWLLRVFFAASIGFQVPVKVRFTDLTVLIFMGSYSGILTLSSFLYHTAIWRSVCGRLGIYPLRLRRGQVTSCFLRAAI